MINKKISLILLFGVGFVILLNSVSAGTSCSNAGQCDCCCAGVGWSSAYCSSGDGWADCCSWTSGGCSAGWTNAQGGQGLDTCCSDSACGYGKYCNSNHVCAQGYHVTAGPCCSWFSSHPSISEPGYYQRYVNAWCTAPYAWAECDWWRSSCDGYWYDDIGFITKVESCEDYTVNISRPDSCYPEYTEECDYAQLVIQIYPPDEGINIYQWRKKDGVEEYAGSSALYVKSDSNGRIVNTQYFVNTCPPITQSSNTIVGETALTFTLGEGESGSDLIGVYTDEYVRVGSTTGSMSNVLSFDVRCECPEGQVWDSDEGRCVEEEGCNDGDRECWDSTNYILCSNGVWGSSVYCGDDYYCSGGYCYENIQPGTDTCAELGGAIGGECCGDGEICDGSSFESSSDCASWKCCVGECVVDPNLMTCGDGTIDAGEECDDGDTEGGDGCSSTCTIETGWDCFGEPSVCEISCTFTSAEWSLSEVVEGTNVNLIVIGVEGCNGKNVKFEVFEKELVGRNPAITNPVNVVFDGNSATGIWIAEYIDDGAWQGNPEYVFKASLVDFPSIIIDDSGELEVLLSGPEPICIEINSCSDYLIKSECINDGCGVADGNVQVNNPSITCGKGVTCGCEWVSDKCGAYYTSVVNSSFIGTCFYDETTDNNCEDGFFSYSWNAIWTWGENNGWLDWNDGPSSNIGDYILDGGKYYYDPDNKFDGCEDGNVLVECPTSIQVGFFGVWNFIIAIVLILLIYIILNNKKNIFKIKKKKVVKKKKK